MINKSNLAEKVVFASKAGKLSRTTRLGIIITAILTFLLFAISFYGLEAGNFTFTVDELANDVGITLYDNQLEKEFTTRLFAQKVDQADGMTALCGTGYTTRPIGHEQCIPSDEELVSVDGSNNGESYIAYTFYLTMVGPSNYMTDVVSTVDIIQTSMGAEEALRVRVIIDGEGTTYAMRQSEMGDNPGELEPYTESFTTSNLVMKKVFSDFVPNEVKKITIVIWYEGEDADHNPNIWSGGVKLAMNFTISNTRNIDEEEN
ncbi:hypothetical protein KHQ88_05680 [Mycoplasmatota bacterium]|nr:hypothetical protein KHQ88_05680 [Mycoplasmatota bacterium]